MHILSTRKMIVGFALVKEDHTYNLHITFEEFNSFSLSIFFFWGIHNLNKQMSGKAGAGPEGGWHGTTSRFNKHIVLQSSSQIERT